MSLACCPSLLAKQLGNATCTYPRPQTVFEMTISQSSPSFDRSQLQNASACATHSPPTPPSARVCHHHELPRMHMKIPSQLGLRPQPLPVQLRISVENISLHTASVDLGPQTLATATKDRQIQILGAAFSSCLASGLAIRGGGDGALTNLGPSSDMFFAPRSLMHVEVSASRTIQGRNRPSH